MLHTDPVRLCDRMLDGDRRRPPAPVGPVLEAPSAATPRQVPSCCHPGSSCPLPGSPATERSPAHRCIRGTVHRGNRSAGTGYCLVRLAAHERRLAHLAMRPRHPHRPPARRRPDPETAHVMVGQFRDVTPKRFVRTAARNVELQPAPPTASTRSCSSTPRSTSSTSTASPLMP